MDDIRPTRWTARNTCELLEVLWVMEATVERQPKLAELLEAVVAGECCAADELPEPAVPKRPAPKVRRAPNQGETYAQTGLGETGKIELSFLHECSGNRRFSE